MSDTDNTGTFGPMGRSYQEKVVSAILTDLQFAEQIADVILPKYFELKYLQEIVRLIFTHRQQFKTWPSVDLVGIMLTKEVGDDLIAHQGKEFLKRVIEQPLNGDMGYIEATAIDFARRQTLMEAMTVAIDRIEQSDYESVSSVIKEAMNKGATRDLGHDYNDIDGAERRASSATRAPIPTGWEVLDRAFNGGWERGTLTTFIAPTGAGKSMFLVNCTAAAVMIGLNALYVTCEMADYKIGLRHDSYFSEVPINDIPSSQDKVKKAIGEKVKGRLFIKEYQTKTATVQTIRAYIQRLISTKNVVPDVVVVDYADLLRSARGHEQKRYELESVYEELRALAQEFKVVMITADQTNRSGLEMEVVTIAQIGESYAKATVCDVIMTVSRRLEDKQTNSGRLFLAKSRLGGDGTVFPFILNTATVKVSVLNTGVDPVAVFMENAKHLREKTSSRASELGFFNKKPKETV